MKERVGRSGRVIGIDIGATKLRIGLARLDGSLERVEVYETPPAKELPDKLLELVRRFPLRDVLAIGVASIGPLDVRRGVILGSPNLGRNERIFLGRTLSELRIPLAFINDGNAAALAERKFGSCKNVDNFVCIQIGTGIGGGAFLNGDLYAGRTGNAMEIGHIVIDEKGELECGCGARGHWEAYCSGRGLPKLVELMAEEEGVFGERARPEEIFEKARRGDRFFSKVVRRFNELNAKALASLANILEPEVVVLGGSVILNNLDLVLADIDSLMDEYLVVEKPRLIPTSLGSNNVLLGAIALAIDRAKRNLVRS